VLFKNIAPTRSRHSQIVRPRQFIEFFLYEVAEYTENQIERITYAKRITIHYSITKVRRICQRQLTSDAKLACDLFEKFMTIKNDLLKGNPPTKISPQLRYPSIYSTKELKILRDEIKNYYEEIKKYHKETEEYYNEVTRLLRVDIEDDYNIIEPK